MQDKIAFECGVVGHNTREIIQMSRGKKYLDCFFIEFEIGTNVPKLQFVLTLGVASFSISC